MNEEEQNLLMLKGVISELPAEDQEKVKEASVRLFAIAREGDYALLALGLVTMAISIERDKAKAQKGR